MKLIIDNTTTDASHLKGSQFLQMHNTTQQAHLGRLCWIKCANITKYPCFSNSEDLMCEALQISLLVFYDMKLLHIAAV